LYAADERALSSDGASCVPGGLGIAPLAVVVPLVSGLVSSAAAKRTAAHIQDRVNKYQSLSDQTLRDIIATYGGEAGQAATQVLQSRGSPVTAPVTAPAAPATPMSVTPIVSLPAPTLIPAATATPAAAGAGTMPPWVVPAAIAGVVLFAMQRR
jgi:hypothetical protein